MSAPRPLTAEARVHAVNVVLTSTARLQMLNLLLDEFGDQLDIAALLHAERREVRAFIERTLRDAAATGDAVQPGDKIRELSRREYAGMFGSPPPIAPGVTR